MTYSILKIYEMTIKMNNAKSIREIDKAMKLIRWNNDIEVSQRVDILNSLYTIKYELRKSGKK